MNWTDFLSEISSGERAVDWLSGQKLSVKEQLSGAEIRVFNKMLPTPNKFLGQTKITDSLGLSQNTIKTHLRNIFRKFQVDSAKSLQNNLAEVDFWLGEMYNKLGKISLSLKHSKLANDFYVKRNALGKINILTQRINL